MWWLSVSAAATGLLVTEKLPALVALAPLLLVAFLRAPSRARVAAVVVGVAVVTVSVVPYLYYSDGASWSAYGGDRYYAVATTPWSGGTEADLTPWQTRDSLTPSFVLDSITDPSGDIPSATLTYAVGRHTGVATFLPVAAALGIAAVLTLRRRPARRGAHAPSAQPRTSVERAGSQRDPADDAPSRAIAGADPTSPSQDTETATTIRPAPDPTTQQSSRPGGLVALAAAGGLLAYVALYLVVFTDNYFGGGQSVGNRYFLQVSLLVPVVAVAAGVTSAAARWCAAAAAMVAVVVLGPQLRRPEEAFFHDRAHVGRPAAAALRRHPGARVAVPVRAGRVRAAAARGIRRLMHVAASLADPWPPSPRCTSPCCSSGASLVPTFRGADEHVHHDFIRRLTETWAYPEYDELDVSRRTLDALGTSPAFPAHAAPVPTEAATHRADRPGWGDLGPDVRNGPPNQMPQHPPLYYVTAAAVLRVLDGDGTAPLDLAVWQLRLLSILALAPLPLSRRRHRPQVQPVGPGRAVRGRRRAGRAAADPHGRDRLERPAHGAARVADPRRGRAHRHRRPPARDRRRHRRARRAGPLHEGLRRARSCPQWPLACLLPVIGAWRGARRSTIGAPLRPGVDSGAAELHSTTQIGDSSAWASPGETRSRADRPEPASDITAPRASATTATAAEPTPDPATEAGGSSEVRGALGRALVVSVLALALGGWWWIRNVIAYGTPQPGVRLRERVPDVELDLLRFAGDFGERFIGSFWGNFGWREAHLPIGVSIGMTVLVVVAVAAACWGQWPRVVLVLPALVASAMVLSSGWGAFKKTGVSYATQGRYLFAGIAGLSVLVALGIARLLRGRTTWQPLVMLDLAVALQVGSCGSACSATGPVRSTSASGPWSSSLRSRAR